MKESLGKHESDLNCVAIHSVDSQFRFRSYSNRISKQSDLDRQCEYSLCPAWIHSLQTSWMCLHSYLEVPLTIHTCIWTALPGFCMMQASCSCLLKRETLLRSCAPHKHLRKTEGKRTKIQKRSQWALVFYAFHNSVHHRLARVSRFIVLHKRLWQLVWCQSQDLFRSPKATEISHSSLHTNTKQMHKHGMETLESLESEMMSQPFALISYRCGG